MFELPLHPIAVHFPIAFGVLLPFLMTFMLIVIRRGFLPSRAWLGPVMLSFLFFASSVTAVQLGERVEEAVEAVVGDDAIHVHEEAGERLQWFSLVVFLSTLIPIFRPNQQIWKVVSLTASVVSLFAVLQAGHTGGELVYKFGASSAHVKEQPAEK